MSLNFDYSKCPNDPKSREDFNNELESIVFNMMFVGVRELDSYIACQKFFDRYLQFSVVQGTPLYNEHYLSYGTVVAFKGITTNVSTLTDAAFSKKVLGILKDTSWEYFATERARVAKANGAI